MKVTITDTWRSTTRAGEFGTKTAREVLDDLVEHVGGGAIASKQVQIDCDTEFMEALQAEVADVLQATEGSHGLPTYRDVPIRVEA